LLNRKGVGARKSAVRGALIEKFLNRLEGKFRQGHDARSWIKKRTRMKLTESAVRQIIRRLGGKLKVSRKSHEKEGTKEAAEFRATLSEPIGKVVGGNPSQAVRIWGLDELSYGLLVIIRSVWARKEARVHAPYKTTYRWDI